MGEKSGAIISGVVGASLWAFQLGFKIVFPDMIIPEWVGVILIGGGTIGLALSALLFVHRILIAKRAVKAISRSYLLRSKYADESTASNEEWAYWQNVDEMPLWKAAYLWTGRMPALYYPMDAPGVVKAFAERMATDVKRGNLVTVESVSRNGHPLLRALGLVADKSEYATVNRTELLSYAKLRNEKPKFLFP